LLYWKVGERTDDTWLSRVHNETNPSPDWRRVNTFSPGVRHSPHYRYHGAIHQIKTLEVSEGLIPFEPDARRKVARTLIGLWQNTGSYFAADRYVEKVFQSAMELHVDGQRSVQASDVPALSADD
jgi:hypothetical protein